MSATAHAGIVWFEDPRCTELAVVGGKGANLGRLAAAGFPVPPGFVVSTDGYDAHVAPLRAGLTDAIRQLPADDPRALETAAAEIRARIEAAPLPGELAAAIRESYAALGGGYVAVRSSGTAEDLDGAAFAGLHDTFLDVHGADAVLDAIRRDWASVWTARAVAYRRTRGFDELPSIAVVVQAMLEPESAGVMFTANPISRDPGQLLINANWGLGESVVQGITNPDQVVVEHESYAISESTLGDKELEVVRDPATGQGVVQRAVAAERRSRAVLEAASVRELAAIGAAIQAHYDAPQDIEWARADDAFWVLQARPITGVDFSAPRAPDLAASPVHVPGSRVRWTTANVDEGLPGTITPLTWSMYFPATESTMRDCWVELGVLREADRAIPEDVDGRFISVAYGHAIANVDVMSGLAERLPGSSAAQMEAQLFGSTLGDGPPPLRGLAKFERWPVVAVKLPLALRRAIPALEPLAHEITRWWEQTVFALDDSPGDAALAALIEAREQFLRVCSVHMVLSIAAQAVLAQVETIAARVGQPGLERELVRSEQGTVEFELVRDLWRLSAKELTIEQFVRTHGYHGPREGLVDSVVWREDPMPLLGLAKAYAARGAAEDVAVTARRRREAQADALRRLTGALPRPLHGPARRFIRFAAQAPDWRETGRACLLRAIDGARAASRRLGHCMYEDGLLESPDGVQFLTIDELAAGGHDRATLAPLIAQRRADHAAYAALTLPHVWRGAPPTEPVAATTAQDVDGATTLAGLGVSAGVAEGTVRVVLDLGDADVPEGTILVCRATDPSWASLFPLARAVVTDVGSALSHAAIVCRELGLPCVTGTRTGTRRLSDGMRVRVDGDAGTVEVLEAHDPSAAEALDG